jgi:uncharacterized glyoxalase superfamily protein PhnB
MTDPRPPYTPWLTPYVIVTDAELTLGFYAQAFGFQVGNIVRDENESLQHVEMYYRDQMVIMFSPEGAYGMESKAPISIDVETPVTFYLYTDDVDGTFLRATEFGGLPIIQPQDMAWGDRMCGIEDPNGYRWLFACSKRDETSDADVLEEDAAAPAEASTSGTSSATGSNVSNNPAFTASSSPATRTNVFDEEEDSDVPPPPTMTH